MGKPGVGDVEVDAEGEDPVAVRVAGTAVTVHSGQLKIYHTAD
ncbi:MAG TPA: hypothetical protein QGF35_04775 [Dehalococcoidia bacterium]|jgi:predicted PhzF superfamily epimerase YddE/YHI9|nr:hypothetical protein [Dehalococcoidia bacterium]